jgi:hypothetical protein
MEGRKEGKKENSEREDFFPSKSYKEAGHLGLKLVTIVTWETEIRSFEI